MSPSRNLRPSQAAPPPVRPSPSAPDALPEVAPAMSDAEMVAFAQRWESELRAAQHAHRFLVGYTQRVELLNGLEEQIIARQKDYAAVQTTYNQALEHAREINDANLREAHDAHQAQMRQLKEAHEAILAAHQHEVDEKRTDALAQQVAHQSWEHEQQQAIEQLTKQHERLKSLVIEWTRREQAAHEAHDARLDVLRQQFTNEQQRLRETLGAEQERLEAHATMLRTEIAALLARLTGSPAVPGGA